MNEQISLTYHQAQAVAERAAKVRNIALRHKGYGYTERTRVTVAIYNPYYTEKKPELHGLYVTVEGSGSAPVPLFAKDLGYPRNFEVARLGMRDENGHIQHPDMDGIGWDEFDMGPQLRALGWVSTTVSFESDADDAAQARYDEGNSPDCSYWTPTRPEGAGWLLAAIYDTEDGPVALFVRDADAGVDSVHGWLFTTENVSDAEAAQSVLTGRTLEEIQRDIDGVMRRIDSAAGVLAVDLPEPDCWAILTPNGSKLVPPGEAKGRKDAYRLFSEEQVRELLHARGVPGALNDQGEKQ